MNSKRFMSIGLVALVAALFALSVGQAFAADINVDEDCSLENAIRSANGAAQVEPLNSCEAGDDDATEADTITIDLSSTTEGVVTIASTLNVTTTVTVDGQGANVEGDGTFRIFSVSGGSLTVESMTISKGYSSGKGGAINVSNGELTLNNSVITGNTADDDGGGIYATKSDVSLTNSAISGNSLDSDGSGDGGGMYYAGNANTSLVIDRSGLDGNSAPGDGGGLYIKSNSSATISNSTFGENTATGNGGGIYNDGDATLTHVTSSNNTAASGGGIYDNSLLHLRNSILSGNSVDDCAGTLNTNVGNLIEDESCGHGELSGAPGMLKMSGLPLYYVLNSDSRAINQGSDDHCLPSDQRGIIRPEDNCDVGASEYEAGAFSFQIQSARAAGADEGGDSGSSGGSGTEPDIPATPKPSTCLNPPEGVTLSGFHNSTQCQQRQGDIGNQAVLDYGYLMAVDIWGWVPQPVRICFPNRGVIILLDAATSPRTIVPLATDIENGSICATVDRAGTAVLMPSDFLTSGHVTNAMQPLSNCTVTTTDYVNLRDAPAGDNVLYIIPNAISLVASQRTAGWYEVSYAGTIGWVSADYATASGSCQ